MHRREKQFWIFLTVLLTAFIATPLVGQRFGLIPFAIRSEGSIKFGFERDVPRYDPTLAPRSWIEVRGLEVGTGLIGGMGGPRGGQFLCWYAYVSISYGWLGAAFGLGAITALAWPRLRRRRASAPALR